MTPKDVYVYVPDEDARWLLLQLKQVLPESAAAMEKALQRAYLQGMIDGVTELP